MLRRLLYRVLIALLAAVAAWQVGAGQRHAAKVQDQAPPQPIVELSDFRFRYIVEAASGDLQWTSCPPIVLPTARAGAKISSGRGFHDRNGLSSSRRERARPGARPRIVPPPRRNRVSARPAIAAFTSACRAPTRSEDKSSELGYGLSVACSG